MFKKIKSWVTNIHCNGNVWQRTLLYVAVSILAYVVVGGVIMGICKAPIILSIVMLGILAWFGIWWLGYALTDVITGFARDKQKNK